MIIRRGSAEVSLGPLASALISDFLWRKEDEYPSSQLYANELENLLRFALEAGRLKHYWRALLGTLSQRDSVLVELRTALHFQRNKLTITEWEPVGLDEKKGEFLLQSPSGSEIFVEVKSPGWEGELSEEEKRGDRKRRPKHIHLETRNVAPWERIQFILDKAYEKFLPNKANLLIIVDDLFWELRHGTEMHARESLYTIGRCGCFTDDHYENLGGVGIFWIENNWLEISYHMNLYLNPFAIAPLPKDFQESFDAQTMTIVR